MTSSTSFYLTNKKTHTKLYRVCLEIAAIHTYVFRPKPADKNILKQDDFFPFFLPTLTHLDVENNPFIIEVIQLCTSIHFKILKLEIVKLLFS